MDNFLSFENNFPSNKIRFSGLHRKCGIYCISRSFTTYLFKFLENGITRKRYNYSHANTAC